MSEISVLYLKLAELAGREFSDIVTQTSLLTAPSGRPRKLRLFFIHGSFLDIWYTLTGDYALHWEYDPIRHLIYRHRLVCFNWGRWMGDWGLALLKGAGGG